MKRAVYISADPGVPVFGSKGCSIHVQEVLRALAGRGVSWTLVSASCAGTPPADLKDVRVRRLDLGPTSGVREREQACLTANAGLRGILDSVGPVDFVYERYSLWSHAGMEWAAERGVPGILEVNAPLIAEQSVHRTLVHRAEAVEVANRAFGSATAIVAVSGEVGTYLGTMGVPPERVHVIPNGVNPARFVSRVEAGVEETTAAPFTVGFVGTLKPWHGVECLIAAVAAAASRVPGIRLLVVGDGPERDRLQGESRRLGIEGQVEFAGAVEPDRVPEYLARMDVGVAPYPRLDTFYFSPLKVYEYMAAGLPVVASRIGQLAGILQHGRSGWLVQPGDIGELADALVQLRLDRGLRRELGISAREQVCRDHTWDGVARRILDLARPACGVTAS